MTDIAFVQTLNSQSRNMQVDVQVITLDDNLNHPYFTSIDISKDNLSPIGIAKIIAPYDNQISKYWTVYTGIVILSFNLKELQQQNTNSSMFLQAHELSEHINNDEYNYSFICKVSKLKEKGKTIIVYLEDLGWKFLQKVPQEFRMQYIAGQPLDKAFQAICEFLGIEYAYSIEKLQEYNFGADGYSIEKEGQVIETVETVLSEWKTQTEEEEENNPLDDPQYENANLINFDNENENNDDYVRNEPNDTSKIEDTEENDENKKLQEQFDRKIIDLFIGNSFYESKLTDNTMSYNSITVTPQSSANTNNDISQVNIDNNENNNTNNDEENSTNVSGTNNNKNIQSSIAKHRKKALSMDYIKTLKPSEATELAKKTNIYDTRTIKRLRRRAMGLFW